MYFRVVATDAAGNRNFLDVSVSLTIDTPVGVGIQPMRPLLLVMKLMLSMSSIDALQQFSPLKLSYS